MKNSRKRLFTSQVKCGAVISRSVCLYGREMTEGLQSNAPARSFRACISAWPCDRFCRERTIIIVVAPERQPTECEKREYYNVYSIRTSSERIVKRREVGRLVSPDESCSRALPLGVHKESSPATGYCNTSQVSTILRFSITVTYTVVVNLDTFTADSELLF